MYQGFPGPPLEKNMGDFPPKLGDIQKRKNSLIIVINIGFNQKTGKIGGILRWIGGLSPTFSISGGPCTRRQFWSTAKNPPNPPLLEGRGVLKKL